MQRCAVPQLLARDMFGDMLDIAACIRGGDDLFDWDDREPDLSFRGYRH